MFSSALLLSLALVPFMVKAEVVPNTPSGSDVYNVGAKCMITWSGDADAGTKDKWKNMSIELMTGANLDMVHLTTVVMDQDGSVGGTYQWDCPAVTPNSMIYFYQFRSPWIDDGETQWTTRFTIASASGETTEPTDFDDRDQVKWGTGTMEGGSPAPDFSGYTGAPGASSSGESTGAPPASATSSTSSSSASPSSTESPSASPSDTDSPSTAPSGSDSKSSSSTSSRMTKSSSSSSSSTGTAGSSEATDGGDGALSIGASSAGLFFAVALAFVSL